MWDLPGPGLKPMSPALAGGFLNTASPGKPQTNKNLKRYYRERFPQKGTPGSCQEPRTPKDLEVRTPKCWRKITVNLEFYTQPNYSSQQGWTKVISEKKQRQVTFVFHRHSMKEQLQDEPQNHRMGQELEVPLSCKGGWCRVLKQGIWLKVGRSSSRPHARHFPTRI